MPTSSVFTSESVTEGHPDKVADQISDAVLDAVLAEDPRGRVACETLLTTGLCVVAGEITTTAHLDVPELAREVICDIGYDDDAMGFNGRSCAVLVALDRQSPEIAAGVDAAFEHRTGAGGEDVRNAQGAGDQGMMFGYACDETEDLLPLPIWLAHRLSMRLAQVRRTGQVGYLRPDGKTQVTVAYDGARPTTLETVVVSTQHQDGVSQDVIRTDLIEHVIDPIVPGDLDRSNLVIHTNPSGAFVFGGPSADTGLTGRKIIVDTYGG
ncbi:MAG TPA: methionine adenosyltransferase, partial [Acidimicrobiales bacterium]|nr:methionine adenosyltransferase [Acidimicrobiales bacterium]